MPTIAAVEQEMAEIVQQLDTIDPSTLKYPIFYHDIRNAISVFLKHAEEYEPNAVPDVVMRFALDFKQFILAGFPEILNQPFQRFAIELRYEMGSQLADPTYTYQDAWAAERVFEIHPEYFVDIGSTVAFCTIVSRVVPCLAIDARPTPFIMPGLRYRQAEAQALPFRSNTVPFLSSLHAVEHFGLGRYGDSIDNRGSIRAIFEYQRIVQVGGHILFSVPVSLEPAIVFNGHRMFTPELVRDMFRRCEVVSDVHLAPEPVTAEEQARRFAQGAGYGAYTVLFKKIR